MQTLSTADPIRLDPAAERYLDLLARVLTRTGFPDAEPVRSSGKKAWLVRALQRILARRGCQLVRRRVVPASRGWPPPHDAETMVSFERLVNVRQCIEAALTDGVPGDLIEAGVWRGGTTIYMRAVLAAHGVEDRDVWVADSFRGFATQRAFDIDRVEDFTGGLGDEELRVDVAEVRRNFERYGLLDEHVRFLVGWFAETLPRLPSERLAVARIDCDLYESTWVALCALHPRVAPGGFVIVDDYGSFAACKQAVDEFRAREQIEVPLERIDAEGVFWRV